MKIRTDFVTNSSSSCFCVRLKLTFDGNKKLTLSGSEGQGDPDAWMECSRVEAERLPNYEIGCQFSSIVEARDDINKLRQLLSHYARSGQLKVLSGAEHLTDATMEMYACVSGEWSYEGEPFRMLGLLGENGGFSSIEDGIAKLKKNGMKQYTDEALEKLILYEDAECDQEFRDAGEELGIDYDTYEYSKKIISKMNDDGEIDVDIEYCNMCDVDEEWDDEEDED